VDSQLPGATATFPSFPGADTVSYCLNSDTSPNNAVPPPCPAPSAQGGTPSTNLCAYAYAVVNSTQTIPNACSNLGTWAQSAVAGLSPYLSPTDPNLLKLLAELCTKVSNDEDSSGRVSHLLAGTDSTTIGNELDGILADAANAGATKTALETWAQGFLLFSACDNNANLLGTSQVLTPVTGTNVPGVGAGSACN
jgi:hypothetical protein